jgi:adenylate cyclase
MDFWKRFRYFYKNREFRVDILTIFLVLITISILSIVGYTYSKMSASILQFSQGTIERVGQIIIEKLTCITRHFERIPIETKSLVKSSDEISLENEQLLSFMETLMQNSPNMASFFLATIDGKILGVFNLKGAYQYNYVFTPSKPLPEDSVWVVRWIDSSPKHPEERWIYLDKNFKVVSQESTQVPTIRPTERPWFQGAVQTRNLYWTGIYYYNPGNKPGITLSAPFIDKQGNIYAIVGVDMSLAFISEFLLEQQVQEHGKAFVLDEHGKIMMSGAPIGQSSSQDLDPFLVQQAYSQFLRRNHENFVTHYNGVSYLVSCREFPAYGSKNWLVMVVAPLKSFFAQMIATQDEVYAISLFILILSAICVIYFSKRISSPIVALSKEVDKIKQLDLSSERRIRSNIKEINLMDESVHAMKMALRTFEKYVPQEILKQLMKKGSEIRLGGEKKDITIFFSDIAGFTSIAETMSTEYLMPLLAEYFDHLSNIILKNGGTIDKYIGDSIMAFWGAPIERPNHVEEACQTALLCRDFVRELNARRREQNKPEFSTRIGINTGTVIVGNIGTEKRMNYTVIGDAVNLASRLQTVNKRYHTQILISKTVNEQIKDRFLTRLIDAAQIEGKKEKIEVFELVSFLPAPIEQIELCRSFMEAYSIYQKGELSKAKALFEAVLQQFPDDYPSQLHLSHIEEAIKAKKQ